MARSKSSSSVRSRVLSRIYGHGKGYVFTSSDFGDLGERSTVDWALYDLVQDGKIQRVARGIYQLPQTHPELGVLSASTEAIAKAIERRDGVRLQPSGAYAANLLGISEQVPMKIVFLTDGPSRTVTVGKRQIQLKQTTTRNMATAGKFSGLLIQALKSMGKDQVPMTVLERVVRRVPRNERQQLRKDARYAPAWIASIMRQLSEVQGEDS